MEGGGGGLRVQQGDQSVQVGGSGGVNNTLAVHVDEVGESITW